MAKILLIGAHGQVSTYLQKVLQDGYELVVAGRDQIDLSQPDLVYAALAKQQPDIIVNPAAYTAVDAAETDTALAFAINRDSVKEIARYSADHATALVHFSTDYVFPGDSSTPYLETDAVGPTGVYGMSKLEGEQAVLDSGASAVILRTSWVYSNHGKNFYKTMLSLADSRDELSVVDDQVGAPTYAGSIASATKQIIDTAIEEGGFSSDQEGLFHFTCQGQTSWAEFAKAIFVENEKRGIKVNGIPSSEYPTPAKRPAFSVLNTKKLFDVYGITLPHWGTALSQCAIETKSLAE